MGSVFFFFNDTATTEIYTLSLHDALPIFWYPFRTLEAFHRILKPGGVLAMRLTNKRFILGLARAFSAAGPTRDRSEEHTSELQSRQYLVCRLLLEKKNNTNASILLATQSH